MVLQIAGGLPPGGQAPVPLLPHIPIPFLEPFFRFMSTFDMNFPLFPYQKLEMTFD
jgi:hypothetical protein